MNSNGPRVQHLGNVRVVHHRQGLAFRLEAGDDLGRVHASFDNLQSDPAFDRLLLLGHEDRAHAAFADLLEQLVGADDCAEPFWDGWLVQRGLARGASLAQETARVVAGVEQDLEALTQGGLDLGTLGSRSLGELLFSDRAFERGAIEVCHYPAPWLPTAVRREQLWARRSCFQRGALGVLVAEVFLPELWQHAEPGAV